MKIYTFTLAVILLFFVLIPPSMAEEQYASVQDTSELAELAARGKYLTIKIAVAGPGDELYFWWGHIGLLIEDELTGRDLFYDWGVFSFDTDNFYLDFAFGRCNFCCAASLANGAASYYIQTNRDFTLYTLDLPPEAKGELLMFAENIILPENRNYRYHHFKDNCATRVRDIIDRAVGGAFKAEYGEAPGRFTLRQHVRRHTWFSPFWDWFFNFLMGQDIDRPTTVWEEMFLPSEIAARAFEFDYTDAFEQRRKLVSDVEIIYRATDRPGTKAIPPLYYKRELMLGCTVALLFFVLKLRAKGILPKKQYSEKILGITQATVGLFLGGMGFLLFFMSFFTDHDYTYNDSNFLFVNPLLLAVVPLALIVAFSKNPEKQRKSGFILRILWSYVFVAGVITIVLRLFPGFYQQNQPTQALVLPSAFVLSIIPDIVLSRLFPLRRSRRNP